jgi:serine phosphatase RsbU (regulator of sigma subunit)
MSTDTEIHGFEARLCCQEIENFVRILRLIRPPSLELKRGEVEIYGNSVFLNGAAGGDHIVYLDFDQRYDLERRIRAADDAGNRKVAAKLAENRGRLGILVGDVSGHQITDGLAAAMLHQAFLTGVLYELDRYGEVTTRIFEILNTRFFNSLSVEKYITLIYGEISSSGQFRFLSAGSPPPLIFSAEYERFVTISPDRLVTFTPLGMLPSEDDVDISKTFGPLGYKPRYTVNEVNLLGVGDILLLYTDGMSEHTSADGRNFVPDEIEETLRQTKHLPAKGIYDAVRDCFLAFAKPDDDMTLVVIKKSGGVT